MAEVTIREYLPGDEAAINAAYNLALGLARPLAEWEWKYPQEPDGRWIMLALGPDGEMVAHFAALPVRVRVGALSVRAGVPADAFSVPEESGGRAARAFAGATEAFLSRYCEPEGLALLFGVSGERAPSLAVSQLSSRAAPQRIGYWVRGGHRRPEITTGHEVRHGFDGEAADALWRRAAARYEVAAVRDAARLRRRFTGRPGVEYLHLTAWRRDEVHAWAVVHVRPPVTRWAELVWDGEDPGAIVALDRAISSGSQAVGCRRTELWLAGDEAAAQAFRALGWERHEHPDRLGLRVRSFHPEIDAAAFSERLYLTMGDTDLV